MGGNRFEGIMLLPPQPPYAIPPLGELHGLARLLARTADRLAARTFAAGRLGPDSLPRLHGQWYQAEEIDFAKLPPGFALKASRGHASTRLVLEQDDMDPGTLRQAAARWLTREPGQRPRLFAEELLLGRNGAPALAWRFRLGQGRLAALSDAPPDRRLVAAAAGLAAGLASGLGEVRIRLHLVAGRVVFGSIRRV
jgi:hypothetical protein